MYYKYYMVPCNVMYYFFFKVHIGNYVWDGTNLPEIFPRMYTMWMKVCMWLLMSSSTNSPVQPKLVGLGIRGTQVNHPSKILWMKWLQ